MEDEEEKIKELEFNNEEEDMEVLNEEQESTNNNDNNDNKFKIVIIILSIVIALLTIFLIIVILSSNKKEKDNTKENNTEEKEKKKDDKKEDDQADSSQAYDAVYLNKYISSSKEITDIDGKKITNKKGDVIYYSNDNEIYLVRKNSNKIIVRKVEKGEVFDVFNDKATGLIMNDKNKFLLGVYKTENNHDILYLFNGTSFSTIDLKDKYLYKYTNSEGENKNIYGDRYIITAKNKSTNNKDYNNFGLYDIKGNKQIIDGTYDGIEYLHDDIFVAIKGDKSGIINKDNKVLLDIKYKSISYLNGLYFVGSNNKLEIYDNSLNKLNSSISIPKLNEFSYHVCCGKLETYKLIKYDDYVLIGVLDKENIYDYSFVSKNGDIKHIGKGYVSVVDNYLVKTSTEDTRIVMYDNLLNEKYVFDALETGLQLSDENVSIFLNYILVINQNKFFNLNTSTDAGHITAFRKINRGYEVLLETNGNKEGTLTISKDGAVLKQAENVSLKDFLEENNNGINFYKTYFIYSAAGVVYVEPIITN